jgi:hypothetical protein
MSVPKLKNKNPELKFTFNNASKGPLLLYFSAEEWQDAGFSLTRSKLYSGVTRKYALDKLSFPKEAKKYIEEVEESQGFEAEIFLTVEKWSGTDPIGYYTEFEGVLKLVDKDVDDVIYAVSVIDSSFEDKVLNRDKTPVIMAKKSPYETLKSLDGAAFVGFTNEGHSITLPSRLDFLWNSMTADRASSYSNDGDGFPIVPKLIKTAGSDDNVTANADEYLSVTGAFYRNSTLVDVAIELKGVFDFNALINTILADESEITISLIIVNSSNEIIETIPISRDIVDLGESASFTRYNVSGQVELETVVPADHYCQLAVFDAGIEGTTIINTGVIFDFSLRTQNGFSPQVNIEAWLSHEIYSRIIQRYTGVSIPVYSEYFGRKNSEPRNYTYNGIGAFRATTNGALIRGFPQTSSIGVDDQIAPLSISLKDKFESDNSIDPIGLGIEIIDGQKTVRIEAIDYFYDKRVALFIDNATNVKKEYNKDLIYNEVAIGNSKAFPDEIIDGVYDYNNKSEFANAITSVQSKKPIISKVSFSNASINEARKKTKQDEPTTDSKYDDINYTIDTVENQAGNAILNGDAEQGTADWSITGDVTTRSILGNNKFVLPSQDSPLDIVLLSQEIGAIETPVISFSYAVIGDQAGTYTPIVNIKATLNDTSVKYLNDDGDWVDDDVNVNLPSISSVPEGSLQALNGFEIAASGALLNVNKIDITFAPFFLGIGVGDNEYIIDDVFASDSSKYKARTTEGFESISGIVNPTESYDIDFAPARCFRRHGKLLRPQLEHKPSTSFVFTNSEKNSTLVSKKDDEDFEVAESTDILVNDLDEPLWTVEKITFNAALTSQQKQDINDVFGDGKPKYLGLIAYKKNPSHSSYNYGWLEDYNSGGINGEASFEIRPISKYVSPRAEKLAAHPDGSVFTAPGGAKFTIKA